MSQLLSDILIYGEKINNYEADATGSTTLWPTDKLYQVTTPTGKRRFLLGGTINRDVSSTLNIYIKNASAEVIAKLATYTAGTGITHFPDYDSGPIIGSLIIIDAGEYVAAVFGTSQGATAHASCQVIEVTV